MKLNLILSTVGIAILLSACGTTSPQLQAPREKHQEVILDAGQTKAIADPKVDILFVVDNSGSMTYHQDTLVANMDKFADRFFKNPRIDYKIGVLKMYDSVFKDGEKACRLATDVRKMNDFGTLETLKNIDGTPMTDVAPYITQDTPNGKDVLKHTVKVGVKCGPEDGEFFAPVLGILGEAGEIDINAPRSEISYAKLQEGLNEKNGNFYDKDAYIVIIFLTDADDVTRGMNSDVFYQSVVKAKGGDRSKVLIASANPDQSHHNASPKTCTIDGTGQPVEFPGLLAQSGGIRLDLCSNDFGSQLALFGELLVKKVAVQTQKLSFVPSVDPEGVTKCLDKTIPNDQLDKNDIIVTYGTQNTAFNDRQRICRGEGGYTVRPIDANNTDIVLSSDLNVDRVPGGQVIVTAIPVNLRNITNGRAQPIR